MLSAVLAGIAFFGAGMICFGAIIGNSMRESPSGKMALARGRAAAARQPHKLEVAGSIPAPATKIQECDGDEFGI